MMTIFTGTVYAGESNSTVQTIVVDANNTTIANHITVKAGEYFKVAFYTSVGTGYQWTLDSKQELALIEQVSVDSAASNDRFSSVPGGKVKEEFYLRVKPEATGQQTLHFFLIRPWESNVKPVQVFDLDAIIEGKKILKGQVDHIIYATPNLDLGIKKLEDLLGIKAIPGGSHPGLGTPMHLLPWGVTFI